MIRKIYSDAFWKRFGHIIKANLGELLKFKRTTILFYPFITSKGLQNIRKVFKTTPEGEDMLKMYYQPWVDKAKTRWDIVLKLQEASNKRLIYKTDSENWGEAEYWASPAIVHNRKYSDCDDYAVLLCYLLRLFGFSEEEVFVSVGNVRKINSTETTYHAYCIAFDYETMTFFPIEGSWYPSISAKEAKAKTTLWMGNPRYETPDWITNDAKSYSKSALPWKFIR